MEEKIDKKTRIKEWIFVIGVIVVVTIASVIAYNYGLKKNDKISKTKDNKDESKVVETKNNKDESKVVETINNEKIYWKLNYNDEAYLVKNDGENYKIIYDLGLESDITSIGLYKNKYYYEEYNNNTVKLKFINLEVDELISNVWLDIPQPTEEECIYGCVSNKVYKSAIIGDSLYFSLSAFSGGRSKDDGLLMLSMDSNDFNDYKTISSLVELGEWYVDENKKNIYFMNFYGNDNSVYKYDTVTGKSTILFKTSSYSDKIGYTNNNVVYYDAKNYNLSLFNLETNNFKILTTSLNWGSYSYFDWYSIDNVFYYHDGKENIMKYDTIEEKSSIYYSLNDLSNFYRFAMYDSNNLKISYKDEKTEYIYNQELVNNFSNIRVQMLDGTFINVTIENLLEIG